MRDRHDFSRTALHVEVIGSGPPVVLAHGLGGSGRNFRPQARALAQRHRFILYDARGHARSDAPTSEDAYTLEELAADMSYIVQEHALGSAILGGLSLGAMTAFACALQGPSQARALLLASLPGTSEARRSWAVQFAEAIERDGLEQAGARFAWSERARFEPATADLVRRGFLQNAPHAIAHLLRRTAGAMSLLLEQESAIERLELPVLLIAGAHDLDALATSEMLAARLPRARFEVIEGAGHLPNLTHREQFNACLSEFLRLLDQREIQASR